MNAHDQKFVIAVSGGVDSTVFLDALLYNRLNELADSSQFGEISMASEQLIVAHFDHGIRKESSEDAQWVSELAKKHGLVFECGSAALGMGVSEAKARQARYTFLRQVCKKHDAILMTAHHQDDVLETMLINLIRGTNWRGLVSLDSDESIQRPLLMVPKSKIIQYAKKHQVTWREDITNQDQNYLRNYVRHMLMPRLLAQNKDAKKQLEQIYKSTKLLKDQINIELQNIINDQPDTSTILRHHCIMWPSNVTKEVIYTYLRNYDSTWHPDSFHLERILHFIKTGAPGKHYELSKSCTIELTEREIQFKNTSFHGKVTRY